VIVKADGVGVIVADGLLKLRFTPAAKLIFNLTVCTALTGVGGVPVGIVPVGMPKVREAGA